MRRDKLQRAPALILALGLMLTGCTGQTGTDETKATQTQLIATSGTEETVEPSPSADITTVDVQTTENRTEEDTTAVKETTDQETESEEESTAEETTAEEPTAEETEEPTAEEETTPETTAEPTTAEPTTPEPTTAEPTTPEPTAPEPTTPEPTTPAPTTPAPTEPTTAEPATTQPIVIVKAVKIEGSVSGTHYIGDTLSGADFTIKVTMSDGNVLTNPAGWAAAPLQLSAASNVITIAYADVSTQITVNANERPAPPTQPSTPTSVSINGMDVVKNAIQYIGVPYVHGGTNLATGSDCSNFTRLLYAQYGVALSGSAAGQFDQGTPITYDQLKPGDLVVQKYAPGTSQYTGHVAMFIGTDERGWGIVINEYPDEGVVVGYITPNERSIYEYRRVCNNVYPGSNDGAYKDAVLYAENLFGLNHQAGPMLCGTVLAGLWKTDQNTKAFYIYNGLGQDEVIYIYPNDKIENKERLERYMQLYLSSDAYVYYKSHWDGVDVIDEIGTGKFWD